MRFAPPPFAIFQEQDFDVIELLLKSEVASPGCGCNQALVQELGAELQERKVRRGNIAPDQDEGHVTLLRANVLRTSCKFSFLNAVLFLRSLVDGNIPSPTTKIHPGRILAELRDVKYTRSLHVEFVYFGKLLNVP